MAFSLKNLIGLRRGAEDVAAALPAMMIEAQRIAHNIHHGEHAQRKSGMGEKFWQFRDYAPGDRPQDIDWRQSAKGDHIYTRERELHSTQKTFFWCASDRGMSYKSRPSLQTKQECAQILALALALLTVRGEEQIGAFGDLLTGRSERAVQKIGVSFLEHKKEERLPPINGFSLPRFSSFVAAGDFLSPIEEIEERFSQLAVSNVNAVLIQVLDPSEIYLDFNGRVEFEGMAQSEHETIDYVPSVRETYQERLRAHNSALEALCKKYGWHYILHRTDTDMGTSLWTLWQNLQSERRSA